MSKANSHTRLLCDIIVECSRIHPVLPTGGTDGLHVLRPDLVPGERGPLSQHVDGRCHSLWDGMRGTMRGM